MGFRRPPADPGGLGATPSPPLGAAAASGGGKTTGSPAQKKEPLGLPFFVEVSGLEPLSKRYTRQLSTRLSVLWFSSRPCRMAGEDDLSL